MSRILIVGGGWSGVAASLAVAKGGGEAILIERTDLLLGSGLVGGIMRNNGRYTATEEGLAMGITLFQTIDKLSRHVNLNFPRHKHASLYDVDLIEPMIQQELVKAGVRLHLSTRISEVKLVQNTIVSLFDGKGNQYDGEAFVDTTGTFGPQKNCQRYGHGCAMCIYRCPTYGPRTSLTEKVGVLGLNGIRADGRFGSMSGSCKILKASLESLLVEELEEKGIYMVPLPKRLIDCTMMVIKSCQQYTSPEYIENLILLDTSQAKLMTPFFPLTELRSIPGFKGARFLDPLGGSIGNSIRYLGITPGDVFLKVEGVENLFCAGEKAGPYVGHTEAIVTGTLAGRNALAYSLGKDLLKISRNTAIGEAISFVNERVLSKIGLKEKYTFSGSLLFEEMKKKGLYSIHQESIRKRVQKEGLEDIFLERLL